MIKNETILSAIYMIQDYSKGLHFLEETVDRVLTELKLLDKELEALQQRSCESCKYGIAYLGTDRKWCEANIQQDGMTTVDKDFCCNRYEPKGK